MAHDKSCALCRPDDPFIEETPEAVRKRRRGTAPATSEGLFYVILMIAVGLVCLAIVGGLWGSDPGFGWRAGVSAGVVLLASPIFLSQDEQLRTRVCNHGFIPPRMSQWRLLHRSRLLRMTDPSRVRPSEVELAVLVRLGDFPTERGRPAAVEFWSGRLVVHLAAGFVVGFGLAEVSPAIASRLLGCLRAKGLLRELTLVEYLKWRWEVSLE